MNEAKYFLLDCHAVKPSINNLFKFGRAVEGKGKGGKREEGDETAGNKIFMLQICKNFPRESSRQESPNC